MFTSVNAKQDSKNTGATQSRGSARPQFCTCGAPIARSLPQITIATIALKYLPEPMTSDQMVSVSPSWQFGHGLKFVRAVLQLPDHCPRSPPPFCPVRKGADVTLTSAGAHSVVVVWRPISARVVGHACKNCVSSEGTCCDHVGGTGGVHVGVHLSDNSF